MRIALLAAAAVLGMGSPALAHHSFAMFDQTKTVTLKGKVLEFQWTNPHSWIELEVANGHGAVDKWSIELNSPNNLTRQGWKRTMLKPGDEVTVTINPLRDGRKGGLFNSVLLPNGTIMGGERPVNGRAINVPTSN